MVTEGFAMTRISESQPMVPSTAAQRSTHITLSVPGRLHGATATKVVDRMIANRPNHEVEANLRRSEALRHETGDVHDATLVASLPSAQSPRMRTPRLCARRTSLPKAPRLTPPADQTPRDGTRHATPIILLCRPKGATSKETRATTGSQSHTARGAMGGAMEKRLGLDVTCQKEG